jgi:hypothetical protein
MTLRTLLIAIALFATACGGSRKSVLITDTAAKAEATDTAKAGEQAQAGDAMWAERSDRTKAEAAIKSWEDAATANPGDANIHRKLTYAYYFMNNVHVRWDEDNDDAQKANFSKGSDSALRALKSANPTFASKIVEGEDTDKVWQAALQSATKEDVPALYWYATNTAKWALKEGLGALLKYKDRALMIMKRCKELDSTYWHGGPARYLGAYWLKIPFGKKPEASKENFEISMKSSPAYLDTKILFAEVYAVRTGDEALFKKTLEEVIAADVNAEASLVPENTNAQRLAKEMLENMEDYF